MGVGVAVGAGVAVGVGVGVGVEVGVGVTVAVAVGVGVAVAVWATFALKVPDGVGVGASAVIVWLLVVVAMKEPATPVPIRAMDATPIASRTANVRSFIFSLVSGGSGPGPKQVIRLGQELSRHRLWHEDRDTYHDRAGMSRPRLWPGFGNRGTHLSSGP